MRLIDANELYCKFIDGESDTEQEKISESVVQIFNPARTDHRPRNHADCAGAAGEAGTGDGGTGRLLSAKTYTTTRYDGNTLTIYRHDRKNLDESKRIVRIKYTSTTTDVGYSESGKEGPYQLVMNQDEFGILTMAQEIADAIFAN